MLLAGAAYGLLLVVPYVVNDVGQIVSTGLTSEVGGPEDLWPYQGGGVVATMWGVAAGLTFIFGPMVVYAAPIWAIFVMWRDRRVLPVRGWLALALAVICGVAFWVGLNSSDGSALIAWYID